ncbi:homoprotocatechuate degradation operon regulator HpaR [Martelella alba]|uniref:Homoprotocatechuate degradation operon regulator HpaR n=1 Tax=Martelella alba TaxID=2590451 RepID=A0A506UBV5_9HYPH|nr:homoprotocatechuate degradation operon regulator HpaR [Martelella alba]TPW31058.1 homoprotocatechuate degradation operon regulator HpaR [Martelella alba]
MQANLRDGFELADTHRTLPMLLLRSREAVMEKFRPVLYAHDITEQQWRVIRVLNERGETDASKLAELASVLAPSLTRMLRSLETRKLVIVRKDASDGRRSLISLTDKGRVFIATVAPTSAQIYADIEARVGSELLERLVNDLQALQAALGEMP